jgi:hypothetical protein
MQRLNRRHLVLALLLAASVAFLLYSFRGTPPRRTEPGAAEASAATPGTEAKRPLQPAAPADADFSRYAALSQADIFSSNRSKPAPPAPKVKPVPPPPPFPGSETAKPAEKKLDLSGWTYMGYVQLDDETLGVIRNDGTGACEYLAVGDSFMGAKVEQVDRDDMRLRSGTSQTTLSRPRDFPVTPLAPGGGSAPQRPPRAAG